MTKIQKTIEIARTDLPRLSSLSKDSAESIRVCLAQKYSNVVVSNINSQTDLEQLAVRRPDIVFMGMDVMPRSHPTDAYDEDIIWVTDFLAKHSIEHTGSGVRAIQLERNKPLAKDAVRLAGFNTASYFVVPKEVKFTGNTTGLSYPLFVKPSDSGAGVGVDEFSISHNEQELRVKIEALKNERGTDIIVEQYLPGREFSIAVLTSQDSGELFAMPIEIVAPKNSKGDRVLGIKTKGENKEVVSPVTNLRLYNELCKLALGSFKAIGGRDYGRIDVRLDADGVPNFLEANLIPSLIKGYGNFPKASKINRGLEFESVIESIVDLALSRKSIALPERQTPYAAEFTLV